MATDNKLLKSLKQNVATYCVDLIKKRPGLVEWLQGEPLSTRDETVKNFLNSQEGIIWMDYKTDIYYRVQKQLGVDMGLCPYFEIGTSKQKAAGYCSDREDVSSCQGSKLFCHYKKSDES